MSVTNSHLTIPLVNSFWDILHTHGNSICKTIIHAALPNIMHMWWICGMFINILFTASSHAHIWFVLVPKMLTECIMYIASVCRHPTHSAKYACIKLITWNPKKCTINGVLHATAHTLHPNSTFPFKVAYELWYTHFNLIYAKTKLQTSLHQFSWNSHVFNSIMYRNLISHCTKTGNMHIWIEIHSCIYIKHGSHCTNLMKLVNVQLHVLYQPWVKCQKIWK